MTAIAARHATLRDRMISAYAMAEARALEEWADACVMVERFAADGPSARHGNAIIRRDTAAVEAERCDGILMALGRMR